MNPPQALIPRARATDPETSRLAAESVTGLRASHAAIIRVFKWWQKYDPSGLTHEELIRHYWNFGNHHDAPLPRQSDSGIRSRCHELVRMERIIDSGERREISTGRKAIVWRLV